MAGFRVVIFLTMRNSYMVALEYATTDSDRLLLVYSTTKFKELGRNLKVLEDIADLALQAQCKNADSQDTEEGKRQTCFGKRRKMKSQVKI